MIPIPGGARRQFQVAFDQENAGVADFAGSLLVQVEAFAEDALVLLAVGESGAARFGSANAATATRSEHLGLVKGEHVDFVCKMESSLNGGVL